MTAFKTYFSSFRGKEIGRILLIDAAAILVITLLLLGSGRYLQAKTLALTSGQSLNQIQETLLTMTAEETQAFLQGMRSLVTTIFIGGILITMSIFLMFSFSTALIWNLLSGKKFSQQHYWRWNALHLVFFFVALIYAAFVFLIKLAVNQWLSRFYYGAFIPLMNQMVISLLVLIFLLFLFLTYYSFVQRYKVFESIGHAFYLIRLHWNQLWRMFLLALLTGLILNLLLTFLQRFFIYPQTAFIFLSGVIFLLYLAWLRLYLVQTVTVTLTPP